jgi:general secretion pathway protein I
MKIKNHKAFTLLEVLVALIILATALSAAIQTSTVSIENTRYLRDKTLAHWVAMNVVTDLQVRNEWLNIGKKTGSAVMAEREWFWEIQVFDTMDKALRRLEIRVYENRNSKESLTVLTAFLSHSSP